MEAIGKARCLPCLGWCEWARLPQLGIGPLMAKLDTGARSSVLHVETQQLFMQAGAPWVRFASGQGRAALACELPVFDQREVRSSSGESQVRVFIRSVLQLGPWQREIELNLTHRARLRHPMLIGRSALAGHWCVDPARQFVLGGKENA